MIHKRFLSCSVTSQVQASGSHHYSPTKQGAGTDGKLGKKKHWKDEFCNDIATTFSGWNNKATFGSKKRQVMYYLLLEYADQWNNFHEK